MPTEMELTLEQTQQGVSYEVSNIRVNSLTMKMETLLEPTSNKLMAPFFARRHNQKYQHGVLAEEKMEQFGKEKSSFHDQGHQQAVKGKKDDEEFGEIRWFDTPAGNPVKKILLKLNLSDHRSILTDSKEYLKMVMERQSVKVKEIQERCIIKAFQDYQIKKGMSMSVQKSQVHEMAKFTRWREIMLG
ncbi:hypothetical protein Tco_0706944 [Tanacetum coccineum]|uniref:Uncharacterized protein n=1 Tax=Tanacetum coccineum TaxID=301880 RepID=A0ABQ4YB00_9ASTR